MNCALRIRTCHLIERIGRNRPLCDRVNIRDASTFRGIPVDIYILHDSCPRENRKLVFGDPKEVAEE